MGVAMPDLPSTSEDSHNLGDKDSIRRRALWALEGKPDVAFSKVEIPEINTPDMEKIGFDFCTSVLFSFASYLTARHPASMQSFTPNTSSGLTNGMNTLVANKRDSFKMLASTSSSKDQLHTLVEEEEEEEETQPSNIQIDLVPNAFGAEKELGVSSVPPSGMTKPTSTRARPATLNLKPLSLVDNCSTSLPTPISSPNIRPGLRPLSLSALTVESALAENRHSVHDEGKPKRSSISYRISYGNGVATGMTGLPTPEMTPTSFGRRASITSSVGGQDDDFFLASQQYPTQGRPLSASEQHFLFKSHNALLARITDLEKALALRRGSTSSTSSSSSSRPVSVASEVESFNSSSEIDDEMLRLVADLRAERDELKRDVEGWRNRVADTEKKMTLLTDRADTERRDAWIARSRASLLELEKSALEKRVQGLDELITVYEQDKRIIIEERSKLEQENVQSKGKIIRLESELERVKRALEEERRARLERKERDRTTTGAYDAQFQQGGYNGNRRSNFASVDSESSATDVEIESPKSMAHLLGLKSVLELREPCLGEDLFDEDGLAGDEDGHGMDINFADPMDASTFGSDDFIRSAGHFQFSGTPGSTRTATPSLARSRSTSPDTPASYPILMPQTASGDKMKTWSFATASRGTSLPQEEVSIDRFFNCLEDVEDGSTNTRSTPSPNPYDYERNKGLFTRGFTYDSDDTVPFFFRPVGGVEESLEEENDSIDHIKQQRDEQIKDETLPKFDDDDLFGEASGIMITFTPAEEGAPVQDMLPRPSPIRVQNIPTISISTAEATTILQPLVTQPEVRPRSVPETSVKVSTPPKSFTITPSSLPRVTSIPRSKSFFGKAPAPPESPITARAPAVKSNAPTSTPPNKQGANLSPSAYSSPTPRSSVRAPATILRRSPPMASTSSSVGASLIRPPQRKPTIPTSIPLSSKGQNSTTLTYTNGSTSKNQTSGTRTWLVFVNSEHNHPCPFI